METYLFLANMTTKKIEQVKHACDFDERVANFLINPGDDVLQNPRILEKLTQVVKEEIDPWVIKHVRAGGSRTPATIFDRPPKRGHKRLRADPLLRLLGEFLDRLLDEVADEELSKKEKRALIRQIKRTIEEAIFRRK